MKTLSESFNELEEDKISNADLFDKWLESRGMTYGDLYYYLNGNGITNFNDILTKSGYIKKNSTGTYKSSSEYHSCDNGLRTPEEKNLDCAVGNIQEALFCHDNKDFTPNPNATNNTSTGKATTKELDLIHIPTGRQVEFKTSYCTKFYGYGDYLKAYYWHRDGHFREFIEKGNILLVYFINLNMVAVIAKKYLDRSVKVIEENVWKPNTQKYWDDIEVGKCIMFNYTMLNGGNSAISDKVSNLINYGGTK